MLTAGAANAERSIMTPYSKKRHVEVLYKQCEIGGAFSPKIIKDMPRVSIQAEMKRRTPTARRGA
jgi:hypothetical protein